MEQALRLSGLLNDLTSWRITDDKKMKALSPSETLERILSSLQKERPHDQRNAAWRQLVDWIAERELRSVLGNIRRRGPDLDSMAVLNELYLGLLESPPKDAARLRLHFRVLDACRRVRKQDSGGMKGQVSLDVFEGGIQDGEDPVGAPERAALEQDAATTLTELIRALPAGRIRDVARLRYQDGASLKEIAARLDVPEGTIKSDLAREVKPRLQRLEAEKRWAAELRKEAS